MIDDGSHAFALLVSALVVGLPALFGVGAIVVGIVRWSRTRQLTAEGVPADAVVVDNQQESRGDSVVFRPVVQFRSRDGRDVRAVVETAVSNRSHLAGTAMPVVYDPADPQRLTRAGDRAGGGIGAIVVGAVFLGFALVAFLIARSALGIFDDPGMSFGDPGSGW